MVDQQRIYQVPRPPAIARGVPANERDQVHASACPRWSSRFSVFALEFTLQRVFARRQNATKHAKA
jgi:hypothetical protein